MRERRNAGNAVQVVGEKERGNSRQKAIHTDRRRARRKKEKNRREGGGKGEWGGEERGGKGTNT